MHRSRLTPRMVIMDSDEEAESLKKKLSLNHKPKKIKVQQEDTNGKFIINTDCPMNHSEENGGILLKKNAASSRNNSFKQSSMRVQSALLRAQHDGKKGNSSKPKNQESYYYEKPAPDNKTKRATTHRREMVPTIVDSNKDIIMAKSVEVTAPLTLFENQHSKNMNLKTSTRLSEITRDIDPQMPGGVLEKHTTSIHPDSHDLMLRRSNRKRCPPLQYWNGERMKISSSPEPCFHENTAQNEFNEFSPDKQVLKINQPSQKNSSTTQNLQISHNSKKRSAMTKNNQLDKPGAEKKETMQSKRRIRFSAINSGITMIGPTIAENINTDWLVNFTEMHLSKTYLPDSEGCRIFRGLVLDGGNTSSGIMLLAPKSISQSDASDLHNLIFCVMTGTVRVLINEASGQVKAYGHFTVPRSATYTIENSAKQKAILSFIMVPCNARK